MAAPVLHYLVIGLACVESPQRAQYMDVLQEIKDWLPIILATIPIAIALTQEQKQRIVNHTKKLLERALVLIVIGFSVKMVYDFIVGDGPPSRLDVLQFTASLLNTGMYIRILISLLKEESSAIAKAEKERLIEETQQLRERVLAANIESDILQRLTQNVDP